MAGDFKSALSAVPGSQIAATQLAATETALFTIPTDVAFSGVMTLTNVTGTAATALVSIVKAGGTAGANNRVIARSLAPGETATVNDLKLGSGDFVSGMSGTAAAISAVIMGVVFSNNPSGGALPAVNLSGTYAARPAAGTAGRIYFCSDIDSAYRDNGTTWDRLKFGVGGTNQPEPPSSGWSTTTLGGAAAAVDKDGRLFTVPSTGGNNARVEYRTLSPGSNYTATAYLDIAAYTGSYVTSGLWLRASSGGGLVVFGQIYDGSTWALGAQKYNTATSFNATYQSWGLNLSRGLPSWLRIRDDGTNRNFEYSYNGIDWALFLAHSRTDFLTPDQIGWGVDNSGGKTGYARLRSWSVA